MRFASLASHPTATLYTGVVPEAAAAFTYKLVCQSSARVHVVLAHHYRLLEDFSNSLKAFSNIFGPEKALQVHLLPILEEVDLDAEHQSLDAYCELLKTLSTLKDPSSQGTTLILTTPEAFFQKLPTPEHFQKKELKLSCGQSQDLKTLANHLMQDLAYQQRSICEEPGYFALRGNLLDVYPLNADGPYRVDFFDTQIDSIRSFDPTSQRSLESISSLSILANASALKSKDSVSLNHYLPKNVHWVLQEPQLLQEEFPRFFQTPETIQASSHSFQFLIDSRPSGDSWSGIQKARTGNDFFSTQPTVLIHSHALSLYDSLSGSKLIGLDRFQEEAQVRKAFFQKLFSWQKEGNRVHIFLHKAQEQERLLEILEEDLELAGFKPDLHIAPITSAFFLPDFFETGESYIGIGIDMLFGRKARHVGPSHGRKRKQASQVDHLLNFSQLTKGDYLVHQDHGICIYRGLETLSSKYGKEELIALEFEDSITLHLKLQDIYLLSP